MVLTLAVSLGIGSLLPPMLQAYCGLPWVVEQALEEGMEGLAPRVPEFLAQVERLSSFLSYTSQFHLVLEQGVRLIRGTPAPFWAHMFSELSARHLIPLQGSRWLHVPKTHHAELSALRRVVWPQGP